MSTDTKMGAFVRGLVRTVFIACYAAFMWASIHHVAAFFNNFEASDNNTVGSYMLAGAIDITALVTTIGVMFFRKSMPRAIQIVLWVFIVGLAVYSFFINWEYASHYQNSSLILQPTGQTTPVLDAKGNVHYVPVMVANTWLLYVNPAMASCFTIFALIYSVVGEFFGAKAPTAAELLEKKKYLEETAGIVESIRQLEEQRKGAGVIQRAKAAALEIKAAAQELSKQPAIAEETEQDSAEEEEEAGDESGPNTDKLTSIKRQEKAAQSTGASKQKEGLSEEESTVASYFPDTRSWLSASDTTVSLKVVSETMNQAMKKLNNRVKSKDLRRTVSPEIVYKSSVVSWALRELIPVDFQKTAQMEAIQDEQGSVEQLGLVERTMLNAITRASAQEQAELQELARTKSLVELTETLRERYPKYASFISEEAVRRVLTALQFEQEEPDLAAAH